MAQGVTGDRMHIPLWLVSGTRGSSKRGAMQKRAKRVRHGRNKEGSIQLSGEGARTQQMLPEHASLTEKRPTKQRLPIIIERIGP